MREEGGGGTVQNIGLRLSFSPQTKRIRRGRKFGKNLSRERRDGAVARGGAKKTLGTDKS